MRWSEVRRWSGLPRPRALFISGILLATGSAVVAAIIVFSGAYNVAASAKHFYITDRLIKLVLWRSIDTHSTGIDAPFLEGEGLARLGGLHYVTGCEPCHGAPGRRQSPIVAGMYPAPPALSGKVDGWSDAELYWIVQHGLKFTGMPQWAGTGRSHEVWPVVAFLRELPAMTPEAYTELAGSAAGAEDLALSPNDEAVASCAACHGDALRPPVSALVPPLQGQSEAYLARALAEYAEDRRQSGIMEPLAVALLPERRAKLARTYAAMARPPAQVGEGAALAGDLERGRRIAEEGLPERNVAACLGCHSAGRSPEFPRLNGMSAAYIAEQLHLFRDGARGDTAYGAIMQAVVRRLPEEDIDAVAAYLARRAPAPPSTAEARP